MVTSLLQSEVVFDELERLNEQYQQLNSAFEAQAKELSESQVCTWGPSSAHQVPTVQCWWYKRAHGHHQHTRCLRYSAGGIRDLMVIISIILSDNVCFLTQNEADKLRAEVSQIKKKLFFVHCVSPSCLLV